MAEAIDPMKAATLPAEVATTRPRRRWIDLALVALFAVVAAIATTMAAGGLGRSLLTLPMILFVPGYLFIQMLVTGPGRPTPFQALMAIGVSPPLVGLLALLTAIIPGGFTAGPIIATVTVACIAMAVAAFVRRGRHAPPDTSVASKA